MSEEPNPLGPELLELLKAERGAPGPSSATAAHLWDRVEAGLSTPAPPALPAPTSLLAPVASAFAVGALVGALGYSQLVSSRVEVRESVREVTKEVRVEVPVVRTVTVTVTKETLREVERASAPSLSEQPKADEALAAERRLIEQARAALLRGRPSDAGRALAQHTLLHPRGRLLEERRALEVQVLLAEGKRSQAQAAAKSFLETYPKSLLRGLVTPAMENK
ncbi:MAG: hypothetical protein HY791_38855 [Deltaproteobacteria bacterium]|nr:hypothetical protein [Deltaproteobacteria bacterium]